MPEDMTKVLQRTAEAWQDFLDTSETGFEKGNCFENAAKFVMDKGPEFEGSYLILCHGMVWSEIHIRFHPHAWVEWGDGARLVIDPSTGDSSPAILLSRQYYRLGMIDMRTVKRFTRDELLKIVAREQNWGPWE